MFSFLTKRRTQKQNQRRRSRNRKWEFESLEARTLMSATVYAPETISADTTWEDPAATYVVAKDLTISPGAELRIAPGTQVRFQNSIGIASLDGSPNSIPPKITVLGKLTMLGDADDPNARPTTFQGNQIAPESDVVRAKANWIMAESGGVVTASNTEFLGGCVISAEQGGSLHLDGGKIDGTVYGSGYFSNVAYSYRSGVYFDEGSSGSVRGLHFGDSLLTVESNASITENEFTDDRPVFADPQYLGFLQHNTFDRGSSQTVLVAGGDLSTAVQWAASGDARAFELDGIVNIKAGGDLVIGNGVAITTIQGSSYLGGFTIESGGDITIGKATLQGYGYVDFDISRVHSDGPILYDLEGFPIPPILGMGLYPVWSTLNVERGGTATLNGTALDGYWQIETAGSLTATGASFAGSTVRGINLSEPNPVQNGHFRGFHPWHKVLPGGKWELKDSAFSGAWLLEVQKDGISDFDRLQMELNGTTPPNPTLPPGELVATNTTFDLSPRPKDDIGGMGISARGSVTVTDSRLPNPGGLPMSVNEGTNNTFVGKFLTATTVTASAASSALGQEVTFTATLHTSAREGQPATGTVTFVEKFLDQPEFLGLPEPKILGTVPLDGNTATLSTPALGLGHHEIVAIYNGDANFNSSPNGISTPWVQTVVAAETTTRLNVSAGAAVLRERLTFTATVTSPCGIDAPGGRVTFMEGKTVLGAAQIKDGIATWETSALAVGKHSITAVYNGDGSFQSSTSSSVNVEISRALTTTSLNSAASSAKYGSMIIFVATVRSPDGCPLPTGKVTFLDGTRVLGTATLNGTGKATFSIAGLSRGSHKITAVYQGDTSLLGSASSEWTVQIVP